MGVAQNIFIGFGRGVSFNRHSGGQITRAIENMRGESRRLDSRQSFDTLDEETQQVG